MIYIYIVHGTVGSLELEGKNRNRIRSINFLHSRAYSSKSRLMHVRWDEKSEKFLFGEREKTGLEKIVTCPLLKVNFIIWSDLTPLSETFDVNPIFLQLR